MSGADIEQGSAGGVAVFHAVAASEVKVEVIVRQEHLGQFLEILRFVLFQPENLWRGEAGEHVVAEKTD